MQGDEALQELAEHYLVSSANVKEAESTKQLYQNKLKQVMEQNNASVMELPNGKVTWRKQFIVKLNK
jgi:hypothetical protein